MTKLLQPAHDNACALDTSIPSRGLYCALEFYARAMDRMHQSDAAGMYLFSTCADEAEADSWWRAVQTIAGRRMGQT